MGGRARRAAKALRKEIVGRLAPLDLFLAGDEEVIARPSREELTRQ